MSALRHQTISVATTGSDGSATGSGSFKAVTGLLVGVFLDYSAGQAATTDVTLAQTKPALGNVLVVSDTATDGYYQPRKQSCDAAGAAISGAYDYPAVNGILTVAVAQADNNETVAVTILYVDAG